GFFGRGGVACRMTCALAPPKPKELIPASAGWESRGKGCSLFTTRRLSFLKSMRGLGFLKWRLGGMVLCLRIRATLMMLATPEADSRCPRLVLTDPMRQGFFLSPQSAALIAAASMGSPIGVPVPWA